MFFTYISYNLLENECTVWSSRVPRQVKYAELHILPNILHSNIHITFILWRGNFLGAHASIQYLMSFLLFIFLKSFFAYLSEILTALEEEVARFEELASGDADGANATGQSEWYFELFPNIYYAIYIYICTDSESSGIFECFHPTSFPPTKDWHNEANMILRTLAMQDM